MQSHASLHPVHPPLALFGRHVLNQTATLVITDDMFRSGVSKPY